MSNDFFSFKQFTVYQEACAMKVGTDGVLLGAWTHIDSSAVSVMDVGSGTGVIALMLAQRCNADITAIEIDEKAALQARENFVRSPWHDTMKVIQGDFLEMSEEVKYDVIVSNPPFFKDSLENPDLQRRIARHNHSLSYPCLISKVSCLLSDLGSFSIIIPAEYESGLRAMAVANGLYVNRCTRMKTKIDKPVSRVLLEMSKIEHLSCENTDLVLLDDAGKKSDDYRRLTEDYYIK